VSEVLVRRLADHVGVGEQDDGVELVPVLGEEHGVEIGERDDELHVVHGDQLPERRQVARIVDPRHERVDVRVVDRWRERVDVHSDRAPARAPERSDDVDPLAGAREEDGGHGRNLDGRLC
jgi:hypothetical protein